MNRSAISSRPALESLETRLLQAADLDNSLDGAFDAGLLDGARTWTDSVTDLEPSAVVKFQLAAPGQLMWRASTFGMGNSSTRPVYELIRDIDDNGVVDPGEVFAQDDRTGRPVQLESGGAYYMRATRTTKDWDFAVSIIPDYAGGDMTTPRNLGAIFGKRSVNDYLGRAEGIYTDSFDLYRFTLPSRGITTLKASGLASTTALRLYQDKNRSGTLGYNEILKSIKVNGIGTMKLNLAAGTYFYALDSSGTGSDYNLTITAPDGAGNTPRDARNLGKLPRTTAFSDFVGADDRADFLKFNLSANRTITAALTGLAANADLELIADRNNNGRLDAGETIATSRSANTADESIRKSLKRGTYFFCIRRISGDTNYALQIS